MLIWDKILKDFDRTLGLCYTKLTILLCALLNLKNMILKLRLCF